MKKIDCVNDITLADITLNDLCKVFAEMDERVRRAHSVEEVVPILRETYFHLRVQVLEDYITKEMENKPDADKPDEAPVKACLDENVTKVNTSVGCHDSDSASNANNTSGMQTTPIPLPTEVPPEFYKPCTGGKVNPGEIIYLNLDGHWRPYRVMANVNGAICLLGLFSIGEINKKALRYYNSMSSQLCSNWYVEILKKNKVLADCLELSKIGNMEFYVHISDWNELQKNCGAITGDLSPAWYNDDDLSNILVYTGRTGMMSILCGEDGELHEFPYGEVANDCMDCFPAEVHPAFTMRLDSIPYYYNPVDRAKLEEFS